MKDVVFHPAPEVDGEPTLPHYDTGDGDVRKLGLLLPKEPPKAFANFGDKVELFDESTLKKIFSDSGRTKARDRFGDEWIKDQDGRGACQGYMTANMQERARVRAGQDRVELSGDFSYAMVNGGRDGGSHLHEGMASIQKHGTASQAIMEQKGLKWEYRKSQIPQAVFDDALRFRAVVGECYYLNSEQEILTAIAKDYDVGVAVHVAGGFSQMDGEGISKGGNGPGNHAVCVDDAVYSTRSGEWLLDDPNSWGLNWGNRGRIYLTFKRHLQQSIRVHRFYAIRAAMDDPHGENPPEPKG